MNQRVDGTRSVAVLGLGNSGRAAVDLIERLGGRSFVTDDRAGVATDSLPASCTVVASADTRAMLAEAVGVVASPGIAKDHHLLAAAQDAGLPILSEPAFAAQYIAAPLLAVTGTNGKSTTVSLLGKILQAAGRDCFIGGNLGRPLCEAAGQRWDVCVVEISSFQLEWPGELRPAIAAILNLSPDHLDRHGDMANYARTKLALTHRMSTQDWLVLSRTDRWWEGMLDDVSARVTTFGIGEADASMRGLVASPQTRTLCGEDGWEVVLAEGWPENPFDWDNVAAAAEMARRFGVSAAAIREGVEAFEPLAHRLARVGSHEGVEYWNDSKATNVGAALRSVEAFDRPVILLAGGVAKGAQFDALAAGGGIKKIVAYGQAGADIAAAVRAGGGSIAVVVRENLGRAFAEAVAEAEVGDVVLLAPACASFDEFGDYAERGRAFEAMVAALAPGPDAEG
jgi:UDP-N-acetylmuramoylalanine--D-glutamate ligase